MAYHRKEEKPLDEVYRELLGERCTRGSLGGTLLRFVVWRLERNYSTSALRPHAVELYQFIRWCEERSLYHAGDITRPILERYQRHLYQYRKKDGKPLAISTQRKVLRCIQVWFKWMTQTNLLPANPAADLELPRLEKRLPDHILSIEETERILAMPRVGTLQGARDRALLELLWTTGMRRAELVRLTLWSVDPKRRTVTIRQGKGKKDRILPVGERALQWLAHYLENVRPRMLVDPDVKALFIAADGIAGISADHVSGLIRLYIKEAGLTIPGSCHLFRHAMATQMLENGADTRWIQAMLGHNSLESTQIYTQVAIHALQAIHKVTHPASRRRETEDEGQNISDRLKVRVPAPPVAELVQPVTEPMPFLESERGIRHRQRYRRGTKISSGERK